MKVSKKKKLIKKNKKKTWINMVNLQNSRFRSWDYDKFIKNNQNKLWSSISSKPNIKELNWKKNLSLK